MALVMMLMLAVQASSGLFANDEPGTTYSPHGPLANMVSEAGSETATAVHVTFINLLLIAVALHVLAVLAYRLFKGQDLVRPMITGMKSLPRDVTPPRQGSPVLALVLLAVMALGVWAITRLGGG
jgi:cytochrome b